MSAPKPQYERGDVRLYLGDCREILPTLGKVDAVVTDPPYEIKNKFGVSELYGTRRMQFHFDTKGITENVIVPSLAKSFLLANAFHCFCDPEQYGLIAGAARDAGLTPKPWAKAKLCPPPPMPGNWWPSAFELAIYGYKPGAWFGDKSGKRCNLMVFDSYRQGIRGNEKEDHPTQKWLPMVEYIVGCVVPPAGEALDPFMGSGTTGVACVRLGRKFIGIEIEPKYFDIACKRIDKAFDDFGLIEATPPAVRQPNLLEVGA